MIRPVPVLLYHSVDDHAPGKFAPFTLSRARFVEHLDRLVELGYSSLTVSQMLGRLAAGVDLPERCVVLTFDDGFADFAANAWPELQARSLEATLYVTTGPVGGTSRWLAGLGAGHLPMLDWDQVSTLAGQGCEIGAHSVNHPPWTACPSPRPSVRSGEARMPWRTDWHGRSVLRVPARLPRPQGAPARRGRRVHLGLGRA